MKQSEQDKLLNEIFDGEKLSTLRRASLERTLTSIRRQRRRQRAVRACVLASMALLVTMGIVLIARRPEPSHTTIVSSPPRPSETGAVKFITDEELFALFPGRAMALIGKPGHQQLVFLDKPAEAPTHQ